MDTAVNWVRLGTALSLYTSKGYERVEADWFVPLEVQKITCPFPQNIMSVAGHGALVGSAEQSFIQMTLAGTLAPGLYVALTPCFRDEPEDATHSKTFMKVELYATGVDLDEAFRKMVTDADLVMRSLSNTLTTRVDTPEGCDLEMNGIEVGSYGIRSARGISWVYGTGLAEPRFSYAIKR